MVASAKLSRIRLITGLLIVALIVGLIAFDYVTNEPKALLEQQSLENEFDAIQPMPDALICDHHVSHKTHQALVGSSYSSKLPYEDIRAHYDAELSKNGWQFHDEQKLRDWWRDLGGGIHALLQGILRCIIRLCRQRC